MGKTKPQASTARATTAFGFSHNFGATSSSSLSYIGEQPDLSEISDPQLTVSLRNLGKKDSTTKAKALEDIHSHIKDTGPSDALLSAWVQLYPRLSIENARQVRQLAHNIQGSITTAAGKRIAPSLPRVIGAWLCGQYDVDRSVARAAAAALKDAFPTPEKQQALWKVYKDALLDFATDAIIDQTVDTLSDERITSKSDAESKYARVCGSAMSMLGQLITMNSGSADFHDKVGQILANKKIWDFVTNSDPYLRRSICLLAVMCAAEFKSELDWSVISSRLLAKGLTVDQLGSSPQYSQALLVLTSTEPAIWTGFYSHKTSAHKKLCQYLEKGSFRGTEDVWRNTAALIHKIPQEALTKSDSSSDAVRGLLDSILKALSSPDEPRFNLTAAWSCFFDMFFRLQSLVPDTTAQEQLFADYIGRTLSKYIESSKGDRTFPQSGSDRLMAFLIKLIGQSSSQSSFAALWPSIVSGLVDKMRLSLPESSKDFSSSQDGVTALSERIFKIKTLCINESTFSSSDPIQHAFHQGDKELLSTATQLLEDRRCKPYGCAAVLLHLVSQQHLEEAKPTIGNFLDRNIQPLLASPSAALSIALWRASGRPTATLLRILLATEPLDERSELALATILASAQPEDVETDADVRDFLSEGTICSITASLIGNESLKGTTPVEAFYGKLLSDTSVDASPQQQEAALSRFSDIATRSPTVVSTITSGDRAAALTAHLLYLANSPYPQITELASSLLAVLQSTSSSTTNGISTATIISNQLSGKGPLISTLSVVELATTQIDASEDKLQTLNGLLPSDQQWKESFQPHLLRRRPNALAITNPLQAVVYTLTEKQDQTASKVLRDDEDFSLAFRLVIYAVRLCSLPAFRDDLASVSGSAICQWLPVALQLINEKLSLESANEMWTDSTPEVLDEAVDILASGNELIRQLLSQDKSTLETMWLPQMGTLQGNSADTYIKGLALADISSRLAQKDGGSMIGVQFDTQITQLHRSKELIQSAVVAYSLREYIISSNAGRKVLNELISNVTQLKVDGLEVSTMSALILLNILLDGDSEALQGIASQRLVFLMQNLVRLLAAATLDLRIESEIFKLLSAIIPAVADIYGDHWQDILESVVSTWTELNNSDDDLPMLHSTLRVYQTLKGLVTKGDEVNEDLLEAWQAKKEDLQRALLNCLQLVSQATEGTDQPREICSRLLGRLLRTVKAKDLDPILPHLSSPSDAVLSTAFSLAQTTIPDQQEKLSVELVLERQIVNLPTELLQLISDAPTAPTGVERRRYLFAWKLIYAHFEKASYKLREAYTGDLKEQGQLSHLLDFLCEDLRIASTRPVDASKWQFVEAYNPADAENTPESLSINLYYSCLLYTPGLVRAWFIEQKNRIKLPLEAWTQKHLTPSLSAASFDNVSQWISAQDKEDSPVEIKINARSSELIASMPIDTESPHIAISVALPPSYPLNAPSVVSKTRVLVSERNWQSWLRTIQIIIFSTGSIIEGLVAFRRSVMGAVSGHTECAICYSIVGACMQTPNKKCGTCKNIFHGSCLFRWFKSSNSSTCPLCRNSFSYA